MNFKLLIGASALYLSSLEPSSAVGLHQQAPHGLQLVELETRMQKADVSLGEMWDWIQKQIPFIKGLVADYKKRMRRKKLSRKIAAIRARKAAAAAGKLQLGDADLPTDQEHLAQLGLSAFKLAQIE